MPFTVSRLGAAICHASLAGLLLTTPALAAAAERKPMQITVHPAAAYGTKPVVLRVKPPAKAIEALQKAGDPALLKLDGVTLSSQKNLILRVYVGAPDASLATGTEDKRYLGNVAVLAAGKTAKGAKKQSVSAQLELTAEQRAAVARSGDLSVTLVPTDADGKEPADAEWTIRKITLDF